MNDKQAISSILTSALGSSGFKRKGASWHLRGDDVIVVLSLQKSNYGNVYFINVGFLIRVLSSELEPKPESCHVYTRAERLLEQDQEAFGELLLLDSSPDCIASKLTALTNRINVELIPKLMQGSTFNGLKQLVKIHPGLPVRVIAKSALETD